MASSSESGLTSDSSSTGPKVVSSSATLGWYDRTKPIFIDLVGDYAGKELFLIEGDSLLRHCFSDERIDFKAGFQLLHAVYVVEKFLQNLLNRHCRFHIVFFDENLPLCIPSSISPLQKSRYLMARVAIQQHLSTKLSEIHPDVAVHNFSSIGDDDFAKYRSEHPIHFVMAHDGAPSISKVTNSDNLAKVLLRSMIYWFHTVGLNIALINGIEFRDSKVFTMILESSLSRRIETALWKKERNRSWEELIDKLESVETDDIDEEKIEVVAKALDEGSVPQEYHVATHAICQYFDQGKKQIFLTSAYILHNILLKHLTLEQRSLPLVVFDGEFEHEVNRFLHDVADIMKQLLETEELDPVNTVDLVDGRLFRVLLQAMCDGDITTNFSDSIKSDWDRIYAVVKNQSQISLSTKGSPSPISSETSANDAPPQESLSVLPFSDPVFDKHLDSIHVKADTTVNARLGSMKLYRETSHWHNYNKPLNPKSAPAPKVTKWKNPLRLNQFYMSEMVKYAASLTGAKGKALDPETITVGPKQLIKFADDEQTETKKGGDKSKKTSTETSKTKEKKGEAKKGTKKAAAGLSKADQMKAENLERKGSTELDKALNSWLAVMKILNGTSSNDTRYQRAVDYLSGLDSVKTNALEGEIRLYMLQSLLNWWTSYCNAGKKTEGLHVVALIWSNLRSMCSAKSSLTKEIAAHMTKICTLIGIPYAIEDLVIPTVERKTSFVFDYPASKSLSIDIDQQAFQLDYCGPYMDRMLDAKRDPRVSSFVPDGWQRKVLDTLDANKSVFVVAPTSAGKTFISFYAMEQILRADNDGVLVYVAPTKALVNQIAAEIQGRFSKKYLLGGKGVWAVHTRDYRINNSSGCQILVTVPHILQIMLLSPSNAKSWSTRVRRIIFDEIHSIGQSEEGVVWEQLLLLAPCPIIALSATVGNPEQFNDWLTETQKSLGSEMVMIKHDTRYSDLRKYIYTPPKTFSFDGLGASNAVGLGLDGLTGFETFHPITSLVDKSRGMPDDLALEPRDCYSLWRTMVEFQTDKYKVPSSLNPAVALPHCIRKKDIFAWEKDLKALVVRWMADQNSPFDKVVAALSSPVNQPKRIETSDENSGAVINPADLKSTTLPLLLELHKRRALPVILFNYDRAQCEKIATSVMKDLVNAEKTWKEGPQWKKMLDGYEKYLERKEKKPKKPVKAKPSKDQDDDGGSKMDRMRDEASDGASIYDMFDPNAPLAEFSFANPKNLQRTELDIMIRQLRFKNINNDLIELLQRGIGVHHAGMNRKYRQCVEMLFRGGYLRVVIATGTLSLGINMPCATVVFSGDSVYLTALNFRQAAGRSGRRGFDLLGNVVFQNISRDRASRLLSSKLPELTGHFPVTTTLVLRLFTLLSDSKRSEYARKAINSLLSQPRLYLGGESFKEAVLHHLRFSIEYLRRNELIGAHGEPINFTSFVQHLYYTENSSFAFHALLKDGYFHRLCADITTRESAVLREMMLTLSHLFGRRAIKHVDDEVAAEIIRRSPSVVYLDPMPKEATKILRQHNASTLDIFTTYVKTFAAQHVHEKERYLPLTRVEIGLVGASDPEKTGKTSVEAESDSDSDVEESWDAEDEDDDQPKGAAKINFIPALSAVKARSAFVALSGHGDNFKTIEDLCSSAREGVFLESAVIPHLDIHPDENSDPLNAYLLDFFMHGSLQPLEKANGIRKSDVWFLLNDFSMVLATICTSLALYLGLNDPNSSGDDSDLLDIMGTGEEGEAENDEREAASSEISGTAPSLTSASTLASSRTNQSATSNTSTVFSKSKKKAVDDWDADEDFQAAKDKFEVAEAAGVNGTGSKNDAEEYEQLTNVYKAFRKLKTEFDAKFKAIWA